MAAAKGKGKKVKDLAPSKRSAKSVKGGSIIPEDLRDRLKRTLNNPSGPRIR